MSRLVTSFRRRPGALMDLEMLAGVLPGFFALFETPAVHLPRPCERMRAAGIRRMARAAVRVRVLFLL